MDNDSAAHDLVFSEAFKILDDLVGRNEVSLDEAEGAKKRYEVLHSAVLTAMAAEKQHLDEAKVLKKRLEEDPANDCTRPGDDDLQTAIQVLKEDEEAAQAEVAIAQEQEQLQQAEVAELTRQRDEAKEQLEALQEEHRQRLLPYIHELDEEISALQSEVDGKQSKVEKYMNDFRALEAQVDTAVSRKGDLVKLHNQFTEELHKAESVPQKAARQVEVAQNLNTQLEAQHNRVSNELEHSEERYTAAQIEIQRLEASHAATMVEVERAEYASEAQERSADSVQKQFHMKHFEAELIVGQQAELEVQLRLRQSELLRGRSEVNAAVQEKDKLLKRLKKLENVIKVVQSTIPSQQAQKEQLCLDVKRTEEQTRRTQDETKTLKADVDLHMMLYLNEEAGGKEKNTLFIISHEQIVELEHSISEYRKVESQSLRALHEASSSRDRAARQCSVQLRKLKESKKQGMLKEMIGRDLKKRRRSIVARVKDFQQLYDLVKNQRNRFVNLIQAARQGIAEMKEKLWISSNELEILRSESSKKDHLLVQRRAETQKDISYRNSLQAKLNGVRILMREKQDRVDEQIAEIEKHNSILNTAEKDMIRLRKQYEVIMELRNYTGVMLIDRNDELCVLYEKANVQETVGKHGDTGLVRLEDEIRLLKIKVADVECSIMAVRKKQPEVPALDQSVAQLQKDILVTKQQGEELAVQLEDPRNPKRWRALPGRIKDKDELRIKINQLEERLNSKKEQLLERELILEEVTNLSNALRLQAIAGKADTLDVARKANDYQTQLRTTKRKMMATISELSMYQATVLKLSAEKASMAEEVQRARLRLADGEAPTSEVERDWQAALRAEAVAERMQAEQKEFMRLLEAKGTMTATSAEPRPHAYIPETLGIPKPYGTFEPFKPMEPGSTMRHIRKPEPKPIVI